METLIAGVGALGGIIGGRLLAAGKNVAFATRDAKSASAILDAGIHVSGVGGESVAFPQELMPLREYTPARQFDLILLATKAQEAMNAAPELMKLLAEDGLLLPIQNGGVAEMLARQYGEKHVLGGLSNLGGTMVRPGVYEQRNAGHLLIGEIGGGESERAARVREWLGSAVEVRISRNFAGAMWSKLLLNCSVTTIGAIAGLTMRQYTGTPAGRELFDKTYAETLSIALQSGARLERMLVDPVPPLEASAYEEWIQEVLNGYGDLKPSMLQDFERGRQTEIGFINGYVAGIAERSGGSAPVNAAIVDTVRAISRKEKHPSPFCIEEILHLAGNA